MLGKKKGLESSLKIFLVEIEDEMKENFCNVKILKHSKRVLRFKKHILKGVLRFKKHILKQCKRRKPGDDDGFARVVMW